MTVARSRSSFRVAACSTLLLLLGGAADAIAASAVTVESAATSEAARLRLLWPTRVAAATEVGPDAVVVTVDQDVDPRAIRDIVAMLPEWIASAEAEGRRIRLVPVAGRAVTATPLGRGIELRLSPAPAGTDNRIPEPDEEAGETAEPAEVAQADDAETAAAQRRLRLTRARLMMETGDPQSAKRELEALRAEVPNSMEVLAALAGVEAQLGRWRRAIGLYDSILELNPDDPALARAKAELLREHGPRFRMDFDHRKVRDAERQLIARASGEALAGMSTIGFVAEGVDLDTPAVRRRDGTIQSFRGRRARGEAYVAMEHEDAGLTRGSLIGGNGIVGVAVRHSRPLAGGTVRGAAIAQDPYWDVVDGIVNEARSDRLQVDYERVLGTDWRLAGRLAVGRYGIAGDPEVARFVRPSLELAYTVVQGPPAITLAYGLDAEYLGGRKSAVDAFGLEYPLLSVVAREVHSGAVALSGSFRPDLRYNLFGGWAYDRLNANGPFLGADIAYEPAVNFEIGLAVGYSLATSRGSDATVTRIGGYLLWRF